MSFNYLFWFPTHQSLYLKKNKSIFLRFYHLFPQHKKLKMTSASSSSARSLFAESKQRLAERVQVNMNNISSLARQIQRGSKSNELLTKAARDMASTENQMENIEENLKKMQLITIHIGYQYENILKSALVLNDVGEQVTAMKR